MTPPSGGSTEAGDAQGSGAPAAISLPFPADRVESFVLEHGLERPGGGFLVAFSGGPDSTALLWALSRAARGHGWPLHAAHLDHSQDAGSRKRAARARSLAAELGVPLLEKRLAPASSPTDRGGPEAEARERRYRFLRQAKAECGADWIAVGHHRDDQIETILLRLLFGSGITGFGAMSPVTGDIIRPLLDLPQDELSRSVLQLGLLTNRDPGNEELSRPRNLVRHRLLPALSATGEFSAEALLSAAAAARGASRRLRETLACRLSLAASETEPRADLDLAGFRQLPDPLAPFALDALRRAAGARYTAPAAARRELERQLAGGPALGCDCGDGWRWTAGDDRLRLERGPAREAVDFSYTLTVPGELSIPEVGFRLRLSESEPAPWMFQGSNSRAAMSLPLKAGQKVLIRNRRPGDRVRPFGCRYQRKLKDVLIDRQVERQRRDELPLLLVGGKIAWVPGITIEDDFRIGNEERTWVAELRPLAASAH